MKHIPLTNLFGIALLIAACSAENFSTTVNSKGGGASGGSSQSAGTTQEDDLENPTIDVAGVNLTGTCYLLGADGQDPETRAAACTLRSPEKAVEVEFQNPKMLIGTQTAPLVSHSQSGRAGLLNTSGKLLSKDSPLSFNFDVPKKMLNDILFSKTKLSFDSFSFTDKPATTAPMIDLPLQRLDTEDDCQSLKKQTATTELRYKFGSSPLNSISVNPADLMPGKHWSLAHNRVYLTPTNTWDDFAPSIPLEKIKICSAGFADKLTVEWTSQSSIVSDKKHLVTMGNLLLYSGAKTITHSADVHNFSKIGWIYDFKYIALKLLNLGSTSIFDSETWCMTGSNYCKFKTESSNEQILDLAKITNQSLRLAAKNVVAGTAGSELVLTVFELIRTPGNSAVNSIVGLDAASGLTTKLSDTVSTLDGIDEAKVKFRVVYAILP